MLEEIGKQVIKGKPIEEILKNFNWKKFEQTTAEIFENNSFKIRKNFRFKTRKRYEIDLVAIKENLVLCVDCKEWGKGRYKKTGIKKAIEKQLERVKELKIFLRKNLIAQSSLNIKNQQLKPLIVTLFQEDLIEENNVQVVPVWKLNSFLLNIESYF